MVYKFVIFVIRTRAALNVDQSEQFWVFDVRVKLKSR